MITSNRDQLEQNGFKITKEVIDGKGNHFVCLENGTPDTCLMMRDNADNNYFLIDIYDEKRANSFLARIEKENK